MTSSNHDSSMPCGQALTEDEKIRRSRRGCTRPGPDGLPTLTKEPAMGDDTQPFSVPEQRASRESEAFRAAAVQSSFVDMTGQRFGMMLVLSYIGRSYWLCRCDCGIEKRAYSGNLRAGRQQSCGCRRFRRTPTEMRFWAKVEKGQSECWEWQAGRTHEGYGTFNINLAGDSSDRARMAHRYSYELHHGSIPEGMSVLHSCDNPPCVRPDHLSLGTHADNMLDMKLKGRARTDVYKVSETDVLDIRSMAAQGVRLAHIAEQYDIGRGYAHSIATGKRR